MMRTSSGHSKSARALQRGRRVEAPRRSSSVPIAASSRSGGPSRTRARSASPRSASLSFAIKNKARADSGLTKIGSQTGRLIGLQVLVHFPRLHAGDVLRPLGPLGLQKLRQDVLAESL